jgi:methyl coenzyme M reductase subunit D
LKNDCRDAIGLGVGFGPGEKDEHPEKKITKIRGESFECSLIILISNFIFR